MDRIPEKARNGLSRRGLLRATGLSAGAAGAAAVGLGALPADAATPTNDAKGSGYRETAHVKAYYQSLARF